MTASATIAAPPAHSPTPGIVTARVASPLGPSHTYPLSASPPLPTLEITEEDALHCEEMFLALLEQVEPTLLVPPTTAPSTSTSLVSDLYISSDEDEDESLGVGPPQATSPPAQLDTPPDGPLDPVPSGSGGHVESPLDSLQEAWYTLIERDSLDEALTLVLQDLSAIGSLSKVVDMDHLREHLLSVHQDLKLRIRTYLLYHQVEPLTMSGQP